MESNIAALAALQVSWHCGPMLVLRIGWKTMTPVGAHRFAAAMTQN